MTAIKDREIADGSVRKEALPAYRKAAVAQFLSLPLPALFLHRVIRNAKIRAVGGHVERHRVSRGPIPVRAPVGAQVQIDRAAAIVEIARVDRVEKTVRTVRRRIGEKPEPLSGAAAEGRRDVSRAEIARACPQATGDSLIDAGLRLHYDDCGVTSAELGGPAASDHLKRADRVGAEGTGRERVEAVGDRDAVEYVKNAVIGSANVEQPIVFGRHARRRRDQLLKLAP